MIKFLLAALFAIVFVSAQAGAATQIVDGNGVLTGATGVLVNGQSYTVTLVDGTCTTVYGACAQASFDFTDQTAALAAAQAILDQVYINTAAGNFDDSGMSKISGCGLSFLCDTMIAYSISGTTVSAAMAENTSSNNDSSRLVTLGSTYDSTANQAMNYARFALEASVPEPATWAMLIGGLGLVGATMRRQRSVRRLI